MNREKNKLGKISIECNINQQIKHDLETMKVTYIEITNIGGISHLLLDKVNPQMNIICGENGVGKTTLLDSIGHVFTNLPTNIIKKNVLSKEGIIKSDILNDDSCKESTILSFRSHTPNHSNMAYSFGHHSIKLICLKVNRSFDYQELNSISKDDRLNENQTSSHSIHGIDYYNIKGWFLHRHLYSVHEGALQPEQIQNFELAKSCFSILNKDFKFSKVDPNENEIMVHTPSGEIYYEYLSSGFKSIISILFGIIKEIELRFKNPFLLAMEFDGIILIDEIELHLHPEWQGKICKALTKVFPKAQFFITTHSPHVVQTAGENEVIALQRQDNQVVQRELPTSEYGYQGWTVEEILKDVMGMEETRTDEYHEAINDFSSAFKAQNKQRAQEAFNKLKKMLHHSNELKAIYQMQLDSLGE